MSGEPEVLIIGAGPVGLSGALALGRAGIRCLLLERRQEYSRYPKAGGVHPWTMEIFREWGLAAPVRALTAGMPARPVIQWRTRLNGATLGEISVGETEADDRLLDSLSPERLSNANQYMLEPLLATAAGELDNVTINLGSTVIDLSVGDDSVTVDFVDTAGARHTVTAQYVVGADGARSIVRRALDIGEHGQESLGTAFNVQFEADLDPYLSDRNIPVIWVVNKDTQGAFIRSSPTSWRYNFDIPPGIDPSIVTPERCEWEVRQGIGEDIPVTINTTWSWKHELAVADTWRRGRAFLVGDAAHHFPPHGGFGMNSGVQDVQNLAWKLTAMLRWSAGDRLLDSYEAERLPVADFNGKQMMHNTREMEKTGFLVQDKMFLEAVEEGTDEGERVRTVIAEGVKAQRAQMVNHGQQFGFQYESAAVVSDGSPIVESSVAEYRPTARPGARVPHSWVILHDAVISTVDLYDGGFILLLGPENSSWEVAASRVREEIGIALKSFILGRDLIPKDESLSELLGRYGLERSGAVLIRPDGFVGFRSATQGNNEYVELASAFSQILDLD